ncbi:MAG: deoxyribodipyrimidine photo-lyase [Acidimicrobiales bacterium]|nr:deoxyribodipyrimidine photo-lyase [Acidimicrobiales bacterium]
MVWFRRDLRLDDNRAWAAATAAHNEVIALFVLEPRLMDAAGQIRRDQLLAHLDALHQDLKALGGGLVVRPGPATSAVPIAVADCEAAALYYNIDVTPFSIERDDAVAKALAVRVHGFNGLTVHEPGAVLTKKGTLSQVFAPFYKTWTATPLAPWPSPGPGRPVIMSGDAIPDPEGPIYQPPGESGAWQRVTAWLEHVDDYPDTRDLPAIPGTSELSADLKFGTLAARTVVDVVGTQTPGRAAFVRQVAWRDWWAHTLALRPDLPDVALKPQYNNIAWRDDPDGFRRWCAGLTGYPIVDAGMRQLLQTGWMHNRVRMICASFLVKDLLIDWRKGERFFRHHLVDADIAQNAGNWQWAAGTGPDAAPYFRVFNPTTQGQKFDPQGDYVRRWIPELSGLPTPAIHQPHNADPSKLASAEVILGQTYPAPVVDHAEARTRALQTYKRALT